MLRFLLDAGADPDFVTDTMYVVVSLSKLEDLTENPMVYIDGHSKPFL